MTGERTRTGHGLAGRRTLMPPRERPAVLIGATLRQGSRRRCRRGCTGRDLGRVAWGAGGWQCRTVPPTVRHARRGIHRRDGAPRHVRGHRAGSVVELHQDRSRDGSAPPGAGRPAEPGRTAGRRALHLAATAAPRGGAARLRVVGRLPCGGGGRRSAVADRAASRGPGRRPAAPRARGRLGLLEHRLPRGRATCRAPPPACRWRPRSNGLSSSPRDLRQRAWPGRQPTWTACRWGTSGTTIRAGSITA